MENEIHFADISILPRSLGLSSEEDARETRELLVMRAGERLLGVFADEADHISNQTTTTTPLPRAPAAIIGIASVRGRMRTVIAPAMLFGGEDKTAHQLTAASLPFIVALRGDEQLALAVQEIADIITIHTDAIEPLSHAGSLVRGIVQHDKELIVVLDPYQIFAHATAQMERRRQRAK